MSRYAQKPKPWNVEPYINHPQFFFFFTNINPNLIEIPVPYNLQWGLDWEQTVQLYMWRFTSSSLFIGDRRMLAEHTSHSSNIIALS